MVKIEFEFNAPDSITMLSPDKPGERGSISKMGYVLDADGLVTTETGYFVRLGDGHCFRINIKPITFTAFGPASHARGELVISDDASPWDRSLCHGTIAIVGQKPTECTNPTPCAEHGVGVREKL